MLWTRGFPKMSLYVRNQPWDQSSHLVTPVIECKKQAFSHTHLFLSIAESNFLVYVSWASCWALNFFKIGFFSLCKGDSDDNLAKLIKLWESQHSPIIFKLQPPNWLLPSSETVRLIETCTFGALWPNLRLNSLFNRKLLGFFQTVRLIELYA